MARKASLGMTYVQTFARVCKTNGAFGTWPESFENLHHVFGPQVYGRSTFHVSGHGS